MPLANKLQINPQANISLTAQLTQQISWLIASGEINEGETLPPIRELAQQLGIHMHTIRIAYQRLEADGIVSVQRRRGTIVLPYDPLTIAENKPNLQTYTIAVLVPGQNPIYEPYIQGIIQTSQETRWLPVFCYTNDNEHISERYINQLVAKQADGFIVTATGTNNMMEELKELNKSTPIVFVDSPDMPGHNVLVDSEGAAYLATKHLVEQHGHKQVGLITAPIKWPNVDLCYQGYMRALEEGGIEQGQDLIIEVNDFYPESGYEGAIRLFGKNPNLKAVFVIADQLALGVIQAFVRLGKHVPRDVAITSYNNIEPAGWVTPGLTTVNLPAYEMGVQAMKMLEALLAGDEVKQKHVVLDTELVIRHSCGCNK